MFSRLWFLLTLVVFLTAGVLPAQVENSKGKTVWDGVYTSGQASRGQTAFTANCSRCHKEDLNGIEGALKGDSFIEKRREDNLETFYLDVKATMPRGSAGKLPVSTYVDILAYVLQENAFPAGNDELKPELLEGIQLVGKGGPRPVPNFVPVLTVGCLIATGPDSWALVNSSEPIRTRDAFDKIEKELIASATRPLGTQRFRLQDAENFDPEPHLVGKVQVKGILVRSPAGERINVNSIETVGPACEK